MKPLHLYFALFLDYILASLLLFTGITFFRSPRGPVRWLNIAMYLAPSLQSNPIIYISLISVLFLTISPVLCDVLKGKRATTSSLRWRILSLSSSDYPGPHSSQIYFSFDFILKMHISHGLICVHLCCILGIVFLLGSRFGILS